jgi:hypothetical protein
MQLVYKEMDDGLVYYFIRGFYASWTRWKGMLPYGPLDHRWTLQIRSILQSIGMWQGSDRSEMDDPDLVFVLKDPIRQSGGRIMIQRSNLQARKGTRVIWSWPFIRDRRP